MGLIAPTLPQVGQPRGTEETDILNSLTTIVNAINGGLDAANLANGAVDSAEVATSLAAILGISTPAGSVRRGKSIIATEESRTNTAYGLLTTPDRIQNLVLPTDGLIVVAYQALMKNSVSNAGNAAIFLAANQLKVANTAGGAPVPQESGGLSSTTNYAALFTTNRGLGLSGANSDSSQVTTGQAIGRDALGEGGVCAIFAAAGTYDVSVQYRASTGSVSAKQRKLWVWTLGF